MGYIVTLFKESMNVIMLPNVSLIVLGILFFCIIVILLEHIARKNNIWFKPSYIITKFYELLYPILNKISKLYAIICGWMHYVEIVWNKFVNLISNIWNKIVIFFDYIWNKIIKRIANKIYNIMVFIKDIFVDLFVNIYDILIFIKNAFVNLLDNIYERFIAIIKYLFGDLDVTIKDLYKSICNGIKMSFASIKLGYESINIPRYVKNCGGIILLICIMYIIVMMKGDIVGYLKN